MWAQEAQETPVPPAPFGSSAPIPPEVSPVVHWPLEAHGENSEGPRDRMERKIIILFSEPQTGTEHVL